ncbi:hypothetical protein K469DRAFT_104019 [Zopfia rhizophila CBS 207.26]|uniref:Uncharacterized protein n=1 Tax=Zopfia rhizophila CBS 207.26 TaxID=1314779 RepID=A0A6A6E779_9PEZI|nr:hypothetical protein K469DRAFT_104019 [Zopfia rhizophila CBS 207.26]
MSQFYQQNYSYNNQPWVPFAANLRYAQYNDPRSKTPASLINHTGHSPGPLSAPQSRNNSQPPEQMSWDDFTYHPSSSPISVRTSDNDSIEVKMLDVSNDMRNFYENENIVTQVTQGEAGMDYQALFTDQNLQNAMAAVMQQQQQQLNDQFNSQFQQPASHNNMVQMAPQHFNQSFGQAYTRQPHQHDPWTGQGQPRNPIVPQSNTAVFDPESDNQVDNSQFLTADWAANNTDPGYLIHPNTSANVLGRHLFSPRSPTIHLPRSLGFLNPPREVIDAHQSPFFSQSTRPYGPDPVTSQPPLPNPPAGGRASYFPTVPPTAPTPPPGLVRSDLQRHSAGFPQSGSASPITSYFPYGQPASIAFSQFESSSQAGSCMTAPNSTHVPDFNNPNPPIPMKTERNIIPMATSSQSSRPENPLSIQSILNPQSELHEQPSRMSNPRAQGSQGQGQQMSQLLKADDISKLQYLTEDQKQKYRPVVASVWNIMQKKPAGSQEHNQARAKLTEWSQRLIAQERTFRNNAKRQGQGQGEQQPQQSQQPSAPAQEQPQQQSQHQAQPQQSLAEASIIAFSDSGYASVRHETGKHVSRLSRADKAVDTLKAHKGAFKETNDATTQVDETEEDYDDGKTIYSNASSTTGSREETYISELVEDLSKSIPTAPRAVDDAVMERFYSTLPGLLKSFARKIGHLGQCRESRVVMVFVSKCRQTILARLKDHMLSQEDKICQEPRATDPDPTPSAKVQDWLHSMHEESGDKRPVELFVGVSGPPDEEPEGANIPKDLPRYRDFIVRNPAYTWLLARLERELLLAPAEPNHMQAISDTILNGLSHGAFQNLSYEKGPHLCDMTFIVDWNPLAFLQEQEYDEKPEVAFERAITLTGTGSDAQALTTAQYLSQTWPLVGDEMLSPLKRVVRCGSGSTTQSNRMRDDTTLSAYLNDSKLRLQVVGTLDSVAEIGEIVAWLGAALRPSPEEQGVVYCSPFINDVSIQTCKADRTTVTSNINFRIEVEELGEDSTPSWRINGRCWHDLFRNPVAVKGYPTQYKPQKDIGIEMPIEIMAGLAGSNLISSFARNLFIKSYSTMLVLTKQIGDVLIWHLLFNENGEHISYADPRVRAISASNTQKISMSTLESARHVLGWCSNVKNLAGGPKANYKIRWSGLQNSHSKGSLEKLSISGGRFITASFSFALGKKDKPAYMKLRDDYISQLRWIAKKFVVLYDVGDRRAWLVDGICTLLHIVRASLQNDLSDSFTDFSCFKPEQLKETDQTCSGKAAAITVLSNVANQNLKLHRKPDESYDEETTKEDGSSEGLTKTKKAYFYFKDRVQQIYHVLEQIITYQCQIDSEDGISFEMKPTTRKHLEGFDFMDVATDDDPLWRRVTTLKARGRGWVDFTRAIHPPTLFGRGFGEILKPLDVRSCASWATVPKKLDYLAVCCLDLDEILKRHGDRDTNPWRIINDIYWHCPDKAFGPCQCVNGSRSTCDRVQVLLPNSFRALWTRGFRSPPSFAGSGAVIFGRSRKFPLKWPAQGNPEEGEPEDTDDESPALSHDSGLGSSLGSTPQTGSNGNPSSSSHPPLVISPLSSGNSSSGRTAPPSTNALSTESAPPSSNPPSTSSTTPSSTTPSSTPPSSNTQPLSSNPPSSSPASNGGSHGDSDASPCLKRKMLDVVDRVRKKRK